MKLLVVFFAIIAVASAGKFEARALPGRSISSQIIDAFEKARVQMPCGFPKFGIPPLAPLKVNHKELAIKTNVLSVDGEVDKARVDGLDQFQIEEMKVSAVLSKATFRFRFPSIVIKSLYDLETIAKAFGFTVEVKGKGNFFMDIKDLVISGTLKYSIFGQLKIKSLIVLVAIGDVDSDIEGIFGQGLGNRKLNELLEEMILLGINDNQEVITKTIESIAVPVVNKSLEGKTLADLIGAIAGGGGSEPTICIPPEDN